MATTSSRELRNTFTAVSGEEKTWDNIYKDGLSPADVMQLIECVIPAHQSDLLLHIIHTAQDDMDEQMEVFLLACQLAVDTGACKAWSMAQTSFEEEYQIQAIKALSYQRRRIPHRKYSHQERTAKSLRVLTMRWGSDWRQHAERSMTLSDRTEMGRGMLQAFANLSDVFPDQQMAFQQVEAIMDSRISSGAGGKWFVLIEDMEEAVKQRINAIISGGDVPEAETSGSGEGLTNPQGAGERTEYVGMEGGEAGGDDVVRMEAQSESQGMAAVGPAQHKVKAGSGSPFIPCETSSSFQSEPVNPSSSINSNMLIDDMPNHPSPSNFTSSTEPLAHSSSPFSSSAEIRSRSPASVPPSLQHPPLTPDSDGPLFSGFPSSGKDQETALDVELRYEFEGHEIAASALGQPATPDATIDDNGDELWDEGDSEDRESGVGVKEGRIPTGKASCTMPHSLRRSQSKEILDAEADETRKGEEERPPQTDVATTRKKPVQRKKVAERRPVAARKHITRAPTARTTVRYGYRSAEERDPRPEREMGTSMASSNKHHFYNIGQSQDTQSPDMTLQNFHEHVVLSNDTDGELKEDGKDSMRALEDTCHRIVFCQHSKYYHLLFPHERDENENNASLGSGKRGVTETRQQLGLLMVNTKEYLSETSSVKEIRTASDLEGMYRDGGRALRQQISHGYCIVIRRSAETVGNSVKQAQTFRETAKKEGLDVCTAVTLAQRSGNKAMGYTQLEGTHLIEREIEVDAQIDRCEKPAEADSDVLDAVALPTPNRVPGFTLQYILESLGTSKVAIAVQLALESPERQSHGEETDEPAEPPLEVPETEKSTFPIREWRSSCSWKEKAQAFQWNRVCSEAGSFTPSQSNAEGAIAITEVLCGQRLNWVAHPLHPGEWELVVLNGGDTIMIPPGRRHAVYTINSSIYAGGHGFSPDLMSLRQTALARKHGAADGARSLMDEMVGGAAADAEKMEREQAGQDTAVLVDVEALDGLERTEMTRATSAVDRVCTKSENDIAAISMLADLALALTTEGFYQEFFAKESPMYSGPWEMALDILHGILQGPDKSAAPEQVVQETNMLDASQNTTGWRSYALSSVQLVKHDPTRRCK